MSFDSKMSHFRGQSMKTAIRTHDNKVYCSDCGKTFKTTMLSRHFKQVHGSMDMCSALQEGQEPKHPWSPHWQDKTLKNGSLDAFLQPKTPQKKVAQPRPQSEISAFDDEQSQPTKRFMQTTTSSPPVSSNATALLRRLRNLSA